MQALALGGLAEVGMRACVREPIAVRRASAEKAAFQLSLRLHGRANADLDAVAFALLIPP